VCERVKEKEETAKEKTDPKLVEQVKVQHNTFSCVCVEVSDIQFCQFLTQKFFQAFSFQSSTNDSTIMKRFIKNIDAKISLSTYVK